MKYDQHQFLNLIDAVESETGQYLDEVCAMKRYEGLGEKGKDLILPGCGEPTLFEIPYEKPTGGIDTIKVCAVEDGMGLWPRYEEAML